jgi:predicted nucleic acid-binding protein
VILVDSDVLIAQLRGVAAARAWLIEVRTSTGPLAVSAVSVAEITGGMRSDERRAVWHLLGSLRIESISEVVVRRAGEYMRAHRRSNVGISLGDYLIAATADVKVTSWRR